MNHLPLLIFVVVAIVIGILLITGGGDPAERESHPTVPPSASTPAPATPPAPPVPDGRPAPAEARPEAGGDYPADPGEIDLARKIEKYSVDDVSLAEAIERVGRFLGCEASFSDSAWELVGESSTTSLHLEDVSASTALDMLTAPFDVAYRIHEGVLWILMPGEEPPETGR